MFCSDRCTVRPVDWEHEDYGKVDGFADDLTAFCHTPHHLYTFRSIVSTFGEWSGVCPSLSKTVLILPDWEQHRKAEWKRACWPEVDIVLFGETLGIQVGAALTIEQVFKKPLARFESALDLWLSQPTGCVDLEFLPYTQNMLRCPILCANQKNDLSLEQFAQEIGSR